MVDDEIGSAAISERETIRRTTPADLPALRTIFGDPAVYEWWGGRPLTDDELADRYLGTRRPDVECFLVYSSDDPVGFVQYHHDGTGSGGGVDLALRPIARGGGLGTGVVSALVEHVRREHGWVRLTVDPDVANPVGLAFWSAVGFEPERRVDDEEGREPYWLLAWPCVDGALAEPPARSADAVAEFATRIHTAASDPVDVIGTYVHGSAALGGFVRGRSDVDILIVVDGSETARHDGLGDALVDAATPCPGRGVELSVVTADATAAPGPPWPFLLHVATDADGVRIVGGVDHPGDPDLALHYAVALAAGITVAGPPPTDVFAPVDTPTIQAALRAELQWGLTEAQPEYAVLNACRAWRFADTGELVSKIAGAAWVLASGPSTLVESAVEAQLGFPSERPDHAAARSFVERIIDQLAVTTR